MISSRELFPAMRAQIAPGPDVDVVPVGIGPERDWQSLKNICQ